MQIVKVSGSAIPLAVGEMTNLFASGEICPQRLAIILLGLPTLGWPSMYPVAKTVF